MKLVHWHEAAQDELLNEIGYLELQTPGLGRRFFAEVSRAEGLIAELPKAAPEIRRGIRKRALRTFRFSLLYAIEKQGILILALAHHSRRPGYWIGRI